MELREALTNEIATKLCQKMGYALDPARTASIAREMDKLVRGGCSMPLAFSVALEDDLLLNGDPLAYKWRSAWERKDGS